MPEVTYEIELKPGLYPKQRTAIFGPQRYAFIEASTKCGKAQPLDAKIYTPFGYKYMGDIAVGDIVLTPTGKSIVDSIHPQGIKDVYKVTFSDGSSCRCTKDHLWEVGHNQYKFSNKIMSLSEIMELSDKDLRHTYIPTTNPVEFDSQPTSIDPYCLGLLLGDGCFRGESLYISSEDDEIISALLEAGMDVNSKSGCDYIINKEKGEYRNSVITYLKSVGLWGKYSDEKFIPSEYIYNSRDVRLAVLQGLLDTDGSIDHCGQPVFEQTSKQLALDVTTLVESLGGFVHCKTKVGSYKNSNGKLIPCKTVYRLRITHPNATELFRLDRKVLASRKKSKSTRRTFRTIELVGKEECQCIKLKDPKGLYLTDRMIVTHNTLGCMQWILDGASQHGNGANCWWVAPVYKQARIAYLRTKRGILQSIFAAQKENPSLVGLKNLFQFREGDLQIILPNEGVISYLSGDNPDNLYGDDVFRAVIDEASRVKKESYYAVRSTITQTNGDLRCIGNVKGRNNWFYQLSRKAETQELKNSAYFKLTAYDAAEAGVFPYEEIEDAKNTLPEEVFNELYLAIASDDGGNPFGFDYIDQCIHPISDKDPICFGLDLGKSNDYTVLIMLDLQRRVCFFERWKANWDTTIKKVKSITSGIRGLGDATGVGDPIIEYLKQTEEGYDGSGVEAFKFTRQSKQPLMESLAIAIQKNKISYPDGFIPEELRLYEYERTATGIIYSAPVGFHDDCVCALALANRAYETLNLIQVNEENFDDSFIASGVRETIRSWDNLLTASEIDEMLELDDLLFQMGYNAHMNDEPIHILDTLNVGSNYNWEV